MTTAASQAVCGDDRRPILGLRPRRGKKNSARLEKRAAAGPATPNTGCVSHRSARPEKRAAAGSATPNTGRSSRCGPARRRAGRRDATGMGTRTTLTHI
ncbi:hypothetical protein NDU88_002625 [Pleurodeles waltl]|uniref:Uncharacterized protein n=1 Tax=Pleurodeles waltl TaxID=8319 RepID=A0AAV7UA90_PLEWA|nr:hypothetical protein NDU88_002625 [Pleurodeles waltl]